MTGFRKKLIILTGAVLFLLPGTSEQPVAAQQMPCAWAPAPLVVVDGNYTKGEWTENLVGLRLPNGWVFCQNDAENLYLLIDLNGDSGNDPPKTAAPWGDYISLSFDVNRDWQITPKVDVAYGLYPGSHRAGLQHYLQPASWTGLQPTGAVAAAGFGRTLTPPPPHRPHRLWEAAIPLREIDAAPGQTVRLGLNTHSENPRFNDYQPKNFIRDFSNLIEVSLAQEPPTVKGVIHPGLKLVPGTSLKMVGPSGGKEAAEAVERTILPDGKVKLTYPDGKTVTKFPGGQTIRYPDGRETTMLYATQARPNIPPSVPDAEELVWLEAHKSGLLEIIRTLVNFEQAAIDNYLQYEGPGSPLYEKIAKRTETIGYLLTP